MLITRPTLLLAWVLGMQGVGKMPYPVETARERRVKKPVACEPHRVREQDFGDRRGRAVRARC